MDKQTSDPCWCVIVVDLGCAISWKFPTTLDFYYLHLQIKVVVDVLIFCRLVPWLRTKFDCESRDLHIASGSFNLDPGQASCNVYTCCKVSLWCARESTASLPWQSQIRNHRAKARLVGIRLCNCSFLQVLNDFNVAETYGLSALVVVVDGADVEKTMVNKVVFNVLSELLLL